MPRLRPGASSMRFLLALSSLLLVAQVAPAAAQLGEPATRGLDTPSTPIAGDFDAFALTDNPAGLATLQGYSLTALYQDLGTTGDARRGGGGAGLYFAKPITLPFLTKLSYGAALEYLRTPAAFEPRYDQAVKLTLGGAYQLAPDVGLGVALGYFFADQALALDGELSLDVGLTIRTGRYLALGLAVHDVTTPVIDGVPAQRRWDGELTIRPTGTSRLELGVGLGLAERRGEAEPRLRIAFAPVAGATVRADVAYAPFNTLAGRDAELRASAGLEFSFGRSAAGFSSLFGDGPDGAGYHGSAGWVRMSAENYPSILPSGPRVEKLVLEGSCGGGRRFVRILAWMRRMERDPELRGIIVQLDSLALGWGQLGELRAAITRLRAAKKRVIAYMVAGSTRDYYVAAAAERVLLDPSGGIRMVGLTSTLMFYKGTFDKLDVQADFIKIREFKSAPEAFTRTGPTDKALEVRNAIFDGVYTALTTDLAKDRSLPLADIKTIIDRGPYTPPEALKAKLVDAVVAEPEAEVAKLLGRYYPIRTADPVTPQRKQWRYPAIAIINIDGDIVDGKSTTLPIIGRALVGGDTIAQSIAWARRNPHIGAIVLRIDSPGGSALASDVMAREVELTRGKKPVICSFGDIAASGGYYVAAPCDRIFAMPTTITGSIGIFTGKFDLSGLARRIGISLETMNRGAHADMESLFRPYSADERAAILHKLYYYYNRFLAVVARGRGRTMAQVHEVARGRVWTGTQAMEQHLIDEYGSAADAIMYAKGKAGIPLTTPTELVMLPAQDRGLLSQLLGLFTQGDALALDDAAPADPALESALTRALIATPGLSNLLRTAPIALLTAPSTPQARLDLDVSP